jgi:hypothetical protein
MFYDIVSWDLNRIKGYYKIIYLFIYLFQKRSLDEYKAKSPLDIELVNGWYIRNKNTKIQYKL